MHCLARKETRLQGGELVYGPIFRVGVFTSISMECMMPPPVLEILTISL